MEHIITFGDVLSFVGGALVIGGVIGLFIWVLAKYAEGFRH